MTSGMVSPFAGSFRGSGRFRNVSPFRARGRAGGQWNPAALTGIRYWLAQDGISDAMTTWTPVVDTQSAGVSTFGTTTAKPTALGWNGTARLYLPGGAGNTLTCTAPASAVSFSAAPYGGGAATTGAATGGATFTFADTGSWESVSLLNGSAETVARFAASDSGLFGHTDVYSVAWSVNYAAAGVKPVVQSNAAGAGHGIVMFGTDDNISVPVAAQPPMRTATGSVFIVLRQFATPANNGRYVYSNNSNVLILSNGTTLAGKAQFGGTAINGATFAAGSKQLIGAFYHQPTAALRLSQGVTISAPSTVASPPGSDPTLRFLGGISGVFADFQMSNFLAVDAEPSADDVARMVAYFGAAS